MAKKVNEKENKTLDQKTNSKKTETKKPAAKKDTTKKVAKKTDTSTTKKEVKKPQTNNTKNEVKAPAKKVESKKVTATKDETKKEVAKKTTKQKTNSNKTVSSKKVKENPVVEKEITSTNKKEDSSSVEVEIKKDATKKTVTKKTSKKKKTSNKKEEVVNNEPEQNDVSNEISTQQTVKQETNINSETSAYVSPTELPDFVNNNYSDSKISETPKKKKNIVLRVIIAIVLIVCAAVIALFCLANNVSALQEHYDDIDAYKNQIVVADENKDSSKEVQLAINLLNNLTFDENTLDATLAVGKPIVYNYLSLEDLNNSNFVKENKLVINQFGYEVDPENSNINIYAAVKYNNFLNMGIVAELGYEFTQTDFVITFKNAKVGNLPSFIYQSKLPTTDIELFRQNISELNVVNDIKIRLLDPTKIKDIKFEDGTTYISLNMEQAINDIINDLFNASNGESKFSQLANYYLGQLFNGSTNIDYSTFVNDMSIWAQEMIGQADTETIGKLIEIFAK